MTYPVKSASDYREYRIVRLDNGIKVFLISDIKPSLQANANNGKHEPGINGILEDKTQHKEIVEDETRLAAAALYVAAGSFHEPPDVGGLAHFLEHMLFMGSEKYPDENGYDSYLNMHGGSSNAYTSDESTVYYFDVQPEYFDGALDMFSHFFISPLLTEDAVDREVKAVDSEFKGRIPDDDWRTDQVLRAFACKDHPYSRFTHGNKKSLVTIPKENKIDVMERLRIFFNTYYSTKQMTLSLCSSVSLNELEAMARKHFNGIKPRSNVKLLHNVQLEDPFKLSQFHKLFFVTPVEEIHFVKLMWHLPPQQRHYKKKPTEYIAWLLQHQCKGSVYAYLKEKGYICSMDAYCSTDFTSFSQFCCTTELTERGMDNIEEVIQTVFQYISMIQRNGASLDIFKQLKKISENCFKYQEPDEPCDLVEVMVDQMNFYEEEDYLNGSSLFTEYDSELIEEIQNMLTTDRVNIMVLSKKYKEDNQDVEKWFKTKYSVKDIPHEWICAEKCTAVNQKLHLPDENPYISDNFHLHPVDLSSYCEYPKIISSTEKGKIWYKPDKKFLLPKADVNFMLLTPVPQQSSFNLMCAHMLEYILDFELEELSYEASVTELDVSQSSDGKCHTISLCGFSDKLFLLFKDTINFLSSFQFSENAFNVSKEQMERDYRNALIKSEELNGTLKQLVMRSVVANPIESLRELVGLTPDQLKEYYKLYFSQMYIESLFQGNITKDEAEDFLSYMYAAFQCKVLPPEKFPEVRTLSLPKGRTVCRHNVFNKKDPNSVIHNYYEIGPPTLRLYNVAALLQHIMEEPLFNILRTKQQLGYSVYCSCEYSEGGILGYSITVETDSDLFTADEIDTKVEDFLKTFYQIVQDESDYDKYVDSYIKLLKQADLSVSDEASRNWSEIYYQDYIFDRRYRSIEMVKQIDKSELLAFMTKYMLDGDNVRMLSVQVIGYPSEDDDDDDDDDEDEDEDEEGEDGEDDEEEEGDVDDEDEEEGDDEEGDDEDEEEDEEEDDDDDDEDVEDLHQSEINLIDVVSEQYTRSITDFVKFREECSFHPFARLLLE